ncbi:ORF6C domain-containing protein [Limosilactobacillus sp. c11Ua_112_M]|uniref:ORF6C domain-containing protein n=1 Tax=Limosilactobacillus portuensis TaxID=2742601 RepID=UPI00177C7645|nr:ORF6C domain-containing protein [Limosilactobacillus portuensis]
MRQFQIGDFLHFKTVVNIPRYNEFPAKRFNDGLRFVETWHPKQELLMDIEELNKGVSND